MMFFKLSKSSKVDRILVVSLSNIGDVILTFPVIDTLRLFFPSARIHVVTGQKAADLLTGIPWIQSIPFDKKMPFQAKWQWLLSLRAVNFDLVVDLRNSMLPFLVAAKAVTWPSLRKCPVHMKFKHMARLNCVLQDVPPGAPRTCVSLSASDSENIDSLLKGIKGYVVVASGAADERKRWPKENFARIVEYLVGRGQKVVLLGDKNDAASAAFIMRSSGLEVIDLCGKTSLRCLVPLLERARFAITNDSGIMHAASYAGKPVIALFGPTDPFYYGPWSAHSRALREGCDIASIRINDVLAEVDKLL